MWYPGIRIIVFLGSILAVPHQLAEIRGDYLESRSNRVFGAY